MPNTILLTKNPNRHTTDEKDISKIRQKLDDPEYIRGAVHRLAIIITNQLLDMGGVYLE